MLTLYKIEPGTVTRTVSNKATGSVRRHIINMGFLPGEKLEMIRCAPWVSIRGAGERLSPFPGNLKILCGEEEK